MMLSNGYVLYGFLSQWSLYFSRGDANLRRAVFHLLDASPMT